MKFAARVLVAILAAAIIARADLILVQKVEGGGQSGEQTIRVKGDKARSDLAQPVSMITDGATGEVVTLMHEGKTFLRISAAQAKAMTEQLQGLRTNSEPATLQPTGRKEKIGEYECDVFVVHLGAITTTYWLAPTFPNYPALLAQLEKFQAGAISALGNGLMPELKIFPGMIVKTEMEMKGKRIVSTLVSVREEEVDPAVFNIPAGYKEITSPTLNFQPRK